MDNHAKLLALARRLDAQKRMQAMGSSAKWSAHLNKARASATTESDVVRRLVAAAPGTCTLELRLAYNNDRGCRGLRPVGASRFHHIVHGAGVVGHQISGRGISVFWFPAPESAKADEEAVPA